MPSAWKEREKKYKKWKNRGRNKHKISWKLVRAIATRIFQQSKRQDTQQYLESMKINTPPAKIYEQLRKIRGRPPRRINMLSRNGNISAKVDIVNCLADAFAEVSDPSNCAAEFKIN